MANYAFISYSHEDIKAVQKLHKRIEGFRIPSMVRKLVRDCPKRLYPIFRDDTDLSGVTLTPAIRKALADSAYLIVVCTENSAKSGWVQKEISTFLESHSMDAVIPVFLSQKKFHKGFFGTFRELEGAEKNAVVYCRGRRKKALFEIVTRILGCLNPDLKQRYGDMRFYTGLWKAMLCVFAVTMLFVDINWLYKENYDVIQYCRDISFSYDWPHAVDELAVNELQYVDDYYICTYSMNRIVKAEHIYREETAQKLPGIFLLEADQMEFYYNNNWNSQAAISRVVFRDQDGQPVFVKNFSLERCVADLTRSPDSSEPYFLPEDMTECLPMPGTGNTGCRIGQIYDEAGRVVQIWFLTDTSSYFISDRNGYYGINYLYDDTDAICAVQFLDMECKVLREFAIEE